MRVRIIISILLIEFKKINNNDIYYHNFLKIKKYTNLTNLTLFDIYHKMIILCVNWDQFNFKLCLELKQFFSTEKYLKINIE